MGSEPSDIVGVDVMEMAAPRANTDEEIEEFFQNMSHCFTPFEWKTIRLPNHNAAYKTQVQQFFKHWTLKEGITEDFLTK